jgi:hypothetical protein
MRRPTRIKSGGFLFVPSFDDRSRTFHRQQPQFNGAINVDEKSMQMAPRQRRQWAGFPAGIFPYPAAGFGSWRHTPAHPVLLPATP